MHRLKLQTLHVTVCVTQFAALLREMDRLNCTACILIEECVLSKRQRPTARAPPHCGLRRALLKRRTGMPSIMSLGSVGSFGSQPTYSMKAIGELSPFRGAVRSTRV